MFLPDSSARFVRRKRRIVPTYIAVVVVTLVIATILLSFQPTSDSRGNNCRVSVNSGRAFDESFAGGPDEYEIEGRKSAKQPRDFDEVWDVVSLPTQRWYRMDRENVVPLVDGGRGLLEEWKESMEAVEKLLGGRVVDDEKDAKGNWIVRRGFLRTHFRFGRQVLLHVENRRRNGTRLGERRRSVLITKKFQDGQCAINVRNLDGKRKPIHIVLPYGGRPNRLKKYLEQFAIHIEKKRENLRLVVSILQEELDDVEKAFRSLKASDEAKRRLKAIVVKGDKSGKFSRAIAIRDAVKSVPKGGLMFVSDVDLKIHEEFWDTCRQNTVRGAQVYYPIFFSLYPYGTGIWAKQGFWRVSSYGMVCVYRDDFHAVRGFGGKEEAFSGWGGEDVVLYNRFRDHRNYGVIRAVEPALLHKWHGKKCPEGEHYVNCMRTVYLTSAGQDRLAKLVADENVNFSSITRDAEPE